MATTEEIALTALAIAQRVTDDLADYLTIVDAAAAYQPLDSDLTALAAATTATFGISLLAYANEAAFKAGVNLEIGVDVQAYNINLTSWAGVVPGDYLTTAAAALAYQPLDAQLTDWATKNSADYLTTAAAALAYQPLDADLTAIAGLAAPGADRVLFYDHSAGAYKHLLMGNNLSLSGTTLNVLDFYPPDQSYGDVVVTAGGTNWSLNGTVVGTTKITDGAVTAAKLDSGPRAAVNLYNLMTFR